MGYYSNVAIAIKKKDFSEMESAIYCHMLDKNQQKFIKNALHLAEKTEIERNEEDYLVLR